MRAFGQLALTPKWDITFNSGYDFVAKELTQTSVGIYRDLGCWEMNANWILFGAFTSYTIDIQKKLLPLKTWRSADAEASLTPMFLTNG